MYARVWRSYREENQRCNRMKGQSQNQAGCNIEWFHPGVVHFSSGLPIVTFYRGGLAPCQLTGILITPRIASKAFLICHCGTDDPDTNPS